MSKPPELTLYAYDTRPDIKILKKALKNEQWLITDRETKLKAIRLKYQAMTTVSTIVEKTMTTVPTIVEKTMTTAQLYNAGSPLWAREYTIYRLFCYMRYSTTAKLIKNSKYNAT